MVQTGGCLCGAVAYEIDALPGPVIECHCRTCRKAHGSAFKVGSPVPKDAFRWTRGEEQLSSYESAPGKLRWFCAVCGSHLVSIRAEAPIVALAVATLDDESVVPAPSAQLWVSEKAEWFDPDPRRRAFAEFAE